MFVNHGKTQRPILYNLEKTVKVYRQYFQRQLKEHGFEITLDQWLILNTLSENFDISQNDIAEKVFKYKASITRIIELSVQNDYLTRAIHTTNRRMYQLSITEKGIQTIEKSNNLVQVFRQKIMTGITAEALQTTQTIMKKIVSNCKENE
jgi:MarR family transcriptional regulator, transcriptional regulator for hemolysin